MTEAAPIHLDRSDVAWLEARHPRPLIDEMVTLGRFVIVEQEKVVSQYESNSNKNR
jgi:hypothetical protein